MPSSPITLLASVTLWVFKISNNRQNLADQNFTLPTNISLKCKSMWCICIHEAWRISNCYLWATNFGENIVFRQEVAFAVRSSMPGSLACMFIVLCIALCVVSTILATGCYLSANMQEQFSQLQYHDHEHHCCVFVGRYSNTPFQK